jgi:alkanesulfonate monooxygenase SsuD/methylene tetrahydromethanopterin reductase-like flavin-dependent oxidoreductase (luciferase family)
MRIGVVILPDERWADGGARWRRAEELGCDHAWTYDHLAWRSLRDSTWFAAMPTLTAAALTTSRIRLGPLVASPNFREPVAFAKELMTLDDLSGGRLTVGIGAGGEGWDATMLGQEAWSRRERADRFAELVSLTDQLLREPATSWRGTYYAADEARSIPGCVQRPRPPFVVAAAGRRGMRLAATLGQGWVTTGDRTGEAAAPDVGARIVADQLTRLTDACAAVDRDPTTIDRLVLTGVGLDAGLSSVESFRDAIGRYAEVGVTDLVVHWPRAEGVFAGDVDRFESILSSVLG